MTDEFQQPSHLGDPQGGSSHCEAWVDYTDPDGGLHQVEEESHQEGERVDEEEGPHLTTPNLFVIVDEGRR